MLIVLTTRRAGAAYLAATLAALEYVGERRRLVVSDGPFADGFEPPRGWEALELGVAPLGARAAGWACLRLGLEAGAADLLLCQDDLEICAFGGAVMNRLAIPPACMALSFFTAFDVAGLRKRPRPHIVVQRAQGTAQALKLPRAALEYLCSVNPFEAPDVPPLERHLFDDALFAIARASPLPYVGHVFPNPVRHRGAVSACGTRRAFPQPWSLGREDAWPGDVAGELPLVYQIP